MAIKINEIPPEGLTIEVEESLDLFDQGRATAPITATVAIKPESSGILHISGRAEGSAVLECSRCLKPFTFVISDAMMDFYLAPERILGSPGEHELGKSDLDMEFFRGEEIEPLDLVREQVLLALPMVPLHAADCKGLCPACGADRNEKNCGCSSDALPERDNPFAALKTIIKPEKE